jgi:hypothetical protein
MAVPPCATEPKSVWSLALGVVSPSAIVTPLPNTVISGADPAVTVPVIAKFTGFSSASLVVKEIVPAFVPAVVVSSRTVKVSDAPARLLARASVR